MKLIEQRFLRGPNLYGSQPCLLAHVDVGDDEGGERRAHALQAMVDDLMRAAGYAVPSGRVLPAKARGHYRIACALPDEQVAARALSAALEGARAEDCRLLGVQLREFAAPEVPPPVREAAASGVPLIRLDDGAFQLGWGCRQRLAGGDGAGLAMPEGGGRIPVIAVTGTNGKTTTTLMIAHAVRQAGHTAGWTTTQGVFVDGEQVAQGDCTGYWSALDVLCDQRVGFAVLETARGGILKRGLAFDRCDVAVVLNVTADHLGMEGVETVADLAKVKAVVARSAARAVVLNADDAACVAMAPEPHTGTETFYFSMDAANPLLSRHLGEGGRAVFLSGDSLVLGEGKACTPLLQVSDVPSTIQGRARYNIANALAAAAALLAADLDAAQVAHGLSTFVSDARANPLRTNIFDVEGITAVVDYAHNKAAYAALAQMARGLAGGRRVVGVITACGDRRDSDLEEIGATCARGFDDVVVYESQSRGRVVGGTVQVLLRGARAAGAEAGIHEEWVDIDAIRKGLSLCGPGDVLVFACGTSLDTFVEALRLPAPAAAERIAASLA